MMLIMRPNGTSQLSNHYPKILKCSHVADLFWWLNKDVFTRITKATEVVAFVCFIVIKKMIIFTEKKMLLQAQTISQTF